MAELVIPDLPLLQQWLTDSRISFEESAVGEGLHLPALRNVEGIIDSRIFVEGYGLLLTTELEVRPMAILPLSADMGRLNMDFPTLKVFLDVVDDTAPQLVAAGVLPTSAGLRPQQVASFIELTQEETRTLAAQCLQLDYLFAEPEGGRSEGATALH